VLIRYEYKFFYFFEVRKFFHAHFVKKCGRDIWRAQVFPCAFCKKILARFAEKSEFN
jgi:hypothetical protein